MSPEQIKAAKSLRTALRKVAAADLSLRVYDGDVWVAPNDVDLWPNGSEGNVFEVLEEHGANVSVEGLEADGGAGV